MHAAPGRIMRATFDLVMDATYVRAMRLSGLHAAYVRLMTGSGRDLRQDLIVATA
jgi:hypothetical protein